MNEIVVENQLCPFFNGSINEIINWSNYSSVPNKRAVPNKHAGGEIL